MDQRVVTVVIFMKENLQRKITLNEMARHVNLSIWHLSHLFKTETGLSITEYLRNIRMQEAKELLETTFLSVKEIMTRVGVRDNSHFAKDFRRISGGLTPTRYRKNRHPILVEKTKTKHIAKSAAK
jgi:two-component system response regulator YesN